MSFLVKTQTENTFATPQGLQASQQIQSVWVFFLNAQNSRAFRAIRAFRAFRWWTVAEIDRATDQVFVPRVLGAHLRQLLTVGPPASPFAAGI